MLNKRTVIWMCLFLSIMAFGFVGCVPKTKRIPITWEPSFYESSISRIVLMPIVDARPDKSFEVDLNDFKGRVKDTLEEKGYTVVLPNNYSETMDITAEDVAEMSAKELASLGLENEFFLLFVYVEDILSEYVIMAYKFKIEAVGSLISKSKKIELWRDKGIGRSGQGGLISGLTQGLNRSGAYDGCVISMLESLPDKEIKK